jgi:hypothetical protein
VICLFIGEHVLSGELDTRAARLRHTGDCQAAPNATIAAINVKRKVPATVCRKRHGKIRRWPMALFVVFFWFDFT